MLLYYFMMFVISVPITNSGCLTGNSLQATRIALKILFCIVFSVFLLCSLMLYYPSLISHIQLLWSHMHIFLKVNMLLWFMFCLSPKKLYRDKPEKQVANVVRQRQRALSCFKADKHFQAAFMGNKCRQTHCDSQAQRAVYYPIRGVCR